MKSYNVICRRATEKDDIAAIARYIYLTDPYIYPTICNSPDDESWINMISCCYFSNNNIFSMENFFVAELDNKIVGILCIVPCGQHKRFAEDVSINISLNPGLTKANIGYFCPLIEEILAFDGFNITNLCIDETCQGSGIGTKLLEFCLKYYGSSKIHLDVIAHNRSAIALYQKMGFKISAEYNGFSGNEQPLLCYHMERIPCINVNSESY